MKYSAGLVIIYQNKVLLAHPTNGRWAKSYTFPKGGLDPGESALAAAIRETEEEIGVTVKRSQIDKKQYKIEYISNGKMKWTEVPSGQVYKTVYYYIVHINELSDLKIVSEVIPKGNLQIAEVDWAGFLSYSEAVKKISPVMKDIIKHLKKTNEMFELDNFEEFVNEEKVKTTDLSIDTHGKRNTLHVPSLTSGDVTTGFYTNPGGYKGLETWKKDLLKSYGVKDVEVKDGRVTFKSTKFDKWKSDYQNKKSKALGKWGTTE